MKKLERYMRELGIPEDAEFWDDEDVADDNGVDRVVFVKHGNEDWELHKHKGKWSEAGHGQAMGPWAT